MPVSVSMHACSAWPVNIDFTVFGFFLKGYSVEETVEQLMALQSGGSERTQQKRRASSASSTPSSASSAANASSSSALSAHSPVASSVSVPPTTASALRARRSRSRSQKSRKERQQQQHSAPIALEAAESELLTEDRRVAVEEEATEDLLISPSAPRPVAAAAAGIATGVSLSVPDSPGVDSPTTSQPMPGITAVDTSTNAARPPHLSSQVSSMSHSRHDSTAAKTSTTQQAPPPSTPHRPSLQSGASHPPQHTSHHHRTTNNSNNTSSHRHRRSSHRHRHGNSGSAVAGEAVTHGKSKKKSRHATAGGDATRSSSAQHTAHASAATSFALPPMWTYDSAVNPSHHQHHSGGFVQQQQQQHTRHSSAMMSFDDVANAETVAAARMYGGSHHHHHNSHQNTTSNTSYAAIAAAGAAAGGGEGRNTSADTRRAARHKRRKERQSFFLNEDYIKFQRQLQEVEAIGGAGIGASSLQSRFLFEEVTEQFQAFRELAREEQLGSPYAFLSNYYIPIPVAMRLELLQMYYATDPGLFRWAFGDKLNRFDLPGALAALREECASGGANALSGTGNRTLLVANSGNFSVSPSGAAAASGGSFWSGRWKSSPGKLATMDTATLVRLSEQHTDALRRQWDNVKHVCVTVAALYRGKGGMCVPLDMSLLTTIQQCFGLRQEQALDYATAAFGYEHRLETRLFDRLHTFSEYGAICSLIASVWCDDSGYFLSESFRAGCRRMGRLLDEYRLLSELHPCIFGEPMRPRWQVQLDEVQRVITTASLVDKNTVASAAAVPAGSPVGSAATPSPSPVAGNSGTNLVGLAGVQPTPALNSSGSLGGTGASSSGWEALNSSPTVAAAAAAAASGGAANTNTNSSANVHSPLSGNGQYSRRFLMEFPSLMKHLLRICVALGNNGDVNDALDIFFTRIYAYLELLSSRTAPAIVSMVMNATNTSGGLQNVAGLTNVHGSFAGGGGGGSGAASNGSAAASAPAFGKPPLPPHVERVRSHPDLGRVGGLEGGAAYPSPLAHSFSGAAPSPRGSSHGNVNAVGGGARPSLLRAALASSPPGGAGTDAAAAADDVLAAGSSISYVASTVVNTSLFHPASALLPLSAAIAAHNAGSFTSSPLVMHAGGRSFGVEEELPDWSSAAHTTTSGATSPTPPPLGAGAAAAASNNTASALFTSQVGDMVRKAIDKRYLRELCMLLSALPKAWRQLTTLSAEDQAATEKVMGDLAMGLKAIAQVLMASDDFH